MRTRSDMLASWRRWRAEQRERELERLARRVEAGGTPAAGGLGFKLVALAVIVAIVIGVVVMLRSGFDALG